MKPNPKVLYGPEIKSAAATRADATREEKHWRAVGESPATADVMRTAMHEVVAVARAQGILLDPARVESTLAFSREHLHALRTSMLQDLERGRRLEYDAINGAVVRFGDAVGVPTPVNRTLTGLLAALDPGAAPRS